MQASLLWKQRKKHARTQHLTAALLRLPDARKTGKRARMTMMGQVPVTLQGRLRVGHWLAACKIRRSAAKSVLRPTVKRRFVTVTAQQSQAEYTRHARQTAPALLIRIASSHRQR